MIEVLMLGNEEKIQCKERNKLQLTFLELSKTGEKLYLKSRVHSFINGEGNGTPLQYSCLEKNKIQCKEGDKLQLRFFALSKTGKKLHLKSGVYTFIKVGTSWRKVSSPKGYCFMSAFSKLDRCY